MAPQIILNPEVHRLSQMQRYLPQEKNEELEGKLASITDDEISFLVEGLLFSDQPFDEGLMPESVDEVEKYQVISYQSLR